MFCEVGYFVHLLNARNSNNNNNNNNKYKQKWSKGTVLEKNGKKIC